MSDRNNIIQKVGSMIFDKVDGDTVHLIDSFITMAVNNASKRIVKEKPLGYEKLLATSTVAGASLTSEGLSEGDYDERFALSALTTLIHVPEKFEMVTIEADDGSNTQYRAFPVQSFAALAREEDHEQAYYYIKEPYVYLKYITVTNSFALANVHVTFYSYPTITTFPETLEEYLIQELLVLVQAELAKGKAPKLNG